MSGWIKIHRKLRDNWVWNNPEYLKAWLTILMVVNHKKNKVVIDGEILECNTGESLNSVDTWVKILGKNWSRQKFRTFMKLLENDSMIVSKGLRKTTKITVCNYESYQLDQPTDNQQPTNSQPQLKNDKKDKEDINVGQQPNKQEIEDASFKRLLDFINESTGRNYRVINKTTRNKYKARIKEGYSKDQILNAIATACKQKVHIDTDLKYLTPDFFTRANVLDMYGSKKVNNPVQWDLK